MKNFQAALFDLDGTLFDTEGQYTEIWGNICRKYRPDIPRLEYLIKGTTLVQIFDKYFPDPELQKVITAELIEQESRMHYDWIPGALEFVHEIKAQGIRCAVVTSSNRTKMQWVAQKRPELYTLFDRILTSEDFAASKPNPDCFLLGARVFDLSTDDCVVFEDSFTGLAAGMASGIFTIGLATSNTPDQIRAHCNWVIPNFVGLTAAQVAEQLQRIG